MHRFGRLLSALFVVALLVSSVGPGLATAADGLKTPPVTPVAKTGGPSASAIWGTMYGDVGVIDSYDTYAISPVACNYSQTSGGTKHLSIKVLGPDVYTAPTYHYYYPGYYQYVSWYFGVFRVEANGVDVTLVATSTSQTLLADYYSPAQFLTNTVSNLAVGPTYLIASRVDFYDYYGSLSGYQAYGMEYYHTSWTKSSVTTQLGRGSACSTPSVASSNPSASIPTNSGTPGASLSYSISSFPASTTVTLKWDGSSIGSVKTDSSGKASGHFSIPKSKAGAHTVSFTAGSKSVSKTITVKPAVSLSPTTAKRGATVKIAARGFSSTKKITVYMVKNGAWVAIKSSVTSTTGSADISITVPTWASNGTDSIKLATSVEYAKASLYVNGGPTNSAVVAATKAPTKTATPVETPATSIPTATAKATPIPVETATPTATAIPTEEATATPEPTLTPTEEPAQPPMDEAPPSADSGTPISGG